SLRIASFAVPRRSWDAWWSEISHSLDESAVDAVSLRGIDEKGSARVPARRIPPDTWDNGSLDDGPDPRSGHTAVWTGSVMIVWGGNGGARYDPATDTWTATSTVNAPSARR